MATLNLTIDGQSITCPEGNYVLDAADAVGIYIPRMCHHPDLPSVCQMTWVDTVHQVDATIVGTNPGADTETHCNLCLIEVNGQPDPVNSCTTAVIDGMVIRTDTAEVIKQRKKALAKLLADHPHACLTCAQKEGCSRTDCSSNVPVEERCCSLLGRCELEKVSTYIGIPGETPRYVPQNRAHTTADPLYDRNYELCIGCLRCVRVCQKVQDLDILGATWQEDLAVVGTLTGSTLLEAQCRFCGACVEVCPTGALRDKEDAPAVRRDSPLPCVGSCPAGIDIPRYLKSIAGGNYHEALDIIRSSVPLPGILGYVCFRPCEDSCRRKEIDQSVAICDLKRFVADSVLDKDAIPNQRQSDTGKKVAIIGSGPAGITASCYLSQQGHSVCIFDRESKPGGMLRYGIPDYRLPPDVLDRELAILKILGIELHMNHPFNGEHDIHQLRSEGYDAILVAAGTPVNKDLAIENADLDGIHAGLEFLKSAKLPDKPQLEGNVVVIGGGNVAIDAAMTAIRLGASKVSMVCLESREEMPAHSWEIAQAEEEGLEIYPSWGPVLFTAVENRLSGVELKRCTRVFDDQGRFAPEYDENETTQIPADSVIVAIGQQAEPALLRQVKDLPGEDLSAAGDIMRGPSSVIEAIADGRRAADEIDKYLGGNGLIEPEETPMESVSSGSRVPAEHFRQSRQQSKIAEPDKRKSGFDLIQQTLSEDVAVAEARRCLQCNIRLAITPIVLPPDLWQPMTTEAVDNVSEVEGVFQLLNADKKAVRIAGSQNVQESLRECLDNPGEAVWFVWEEDPMYTKRESELIQQHLQEYGEMPGGAGGDDDLDDLF